ncbi:salmochelin biosynthesis C-glycosyltransferase IroB [Kutzneria viridogrisea]|uniref:Uncharacterized protein n=2 Tax=Kutzneria TaxID=43356 RepID=W5WAA7_9PSEU|nr:nucleotide disphospho-sugar-binding domain-containing protein [Kutzneria albida]AHH98078.1 hypothetical protein KALB_4716 [Kutzneria albida DSM 43870]MBA8924262.1 UDP:flavonoid glycosyltransferase YjiC (YdhE family) [Kutzneria viridogrisea]
MRVLIACISAHGHMFPMITTGWALRAAGHEVLIATAGGLAPVERTGLQGVDIAPGFSMAAPDTEEDSPARSRTPEVEEGADPADHLWAHFFGFMAEMLVDGLVDLVRSWRPDVVLHEETLPIGSLAAINAGVPSIAHGLGVAHDVSGMVDFFTPQLPLFGRFGVRGLPEPSAVIDVSPPSMGTVHGGWPMRYVPYNGAGMVPEWLLRKGSRPRVAVTLGTYAPHRIGLGPIERVVRAARSVDAEFVLAMGEADTSGLGQLPENVHAMGWIPMNALLTTCSAVIHQGGSGTTMTALDAGIPQLVVPQDVDLTAAAVAARGLGASVESEEITPELIDRLLGDPDWAGAAREVRAEMHDMPSPVNVAHRIGELVRACA